ncbi:MAG: prepilin-type N-terminal cleavage/methylation domain-containing protein [Pseudomonadota bacterium]
MGIKGFSLVEMAVVLAIISVLLIGLIGPLSTQEEVRRIKETERRIENIKEALIGFAVSRGRLPCPATAISLGQEVAAGGDCGVGLYDGFVPAVTLSVNPVDEQGYALDAWQNRIRYSVANVNNGGANVLTTNNSIVGVNNMELAAASASLLTVCDDSICTTTLANSIAATVYSLGPNGAIPAASMDEIENTDGDVTFVKRPPRDADHADGAFDDVVDWLSVSVLFGRMAQIGQIPN